MASGTETWGGVLFKWFLPCSFNRFGCRNGNRHGAWGSVLSNWFSLSRHRTAQVPHQSRIQEKNDRELAKIMGGRNNIIWETISFLMSRSDPARGGEKKFFFSLADLKRFNLALYPY
ncbi:hypothetical protein AVEN_116609-1 [Araneus ventricosus]|uniref:Uncharacterized protein n=1 Tax=Araneus ventricosus TaxID=182803 RepID=A0A4Y2DG10_ARAVE|nr:hypothetical protein AVEN_116609-1 [Araneus ventricosus]